MLLYFCQFLSSEGCKNCTWIQQRQNRTAFPKTGCGAGSDGDDRKIVRIGHVQSQTHPDHLGLEAFANYINEKLGDKYRVEVYPSELLGSQTEMVQLTQTGAIDFVVASTAIMEPWKRWHGWMQAPATSTPSRPPSTSPLT